MLQELARQSAAESFAVGSLLFFFVVFVAIAARVLTRGADAYRHQAGLPLEDGAAPSTSARREEV
jgi:hypothetical protein